MIGVESLDVAPTLEDSLYFGEHPLGSSASISEARLAKKQAVAVEGAERKLRASDIDGQRLHASIMLHGAEKLYWPKPVRLTRRRDMLRYALIFLVIAIVAAILGFGFLAAAAATIAKILFGVFLVLFLVGLIMHLGGGRTAV